MFSEIENILFPDRCEVIHLAPTQQFVFPIMKNGSSSFYKNVGQKNWNIVFDNNISKISTPITVFVRDPKQRFISGVNTFVHLLLRDNPRLDKDTIIWFVNNYLFLNLHYCPQFYWLLNLARFLNKDAELDIKSTADIKHYTDLHSNVGVYCEADCVSMIDDATWKKLELYFYLDQILLDSIGQKIKWSQLIKQLSNNTILNKFVFAKSLMLIDQIKCGALE
jgi:hypothetical protein